MAEDLELNKRMSPHPSHQILLQALDCELPSPEMGAVLTHIKQCPACEMRWLRLHALSERVAVLERGPEIPPFPLRLPLSVKVHEFPSSSYWKPAGLVAAAMALAVGLWLWTRAPRRPEAPAVTPVVSSSKASSGNGTAPIVVPSHPVGGRTNTASFAHANRGIRRSVDRTPDLAGLMTAQPPPGGGAKQAAASGTEITVFWALPYSNPALSAEGAHLIHVALPREAFLMAGVPASALPPWSREPVAADVLLGSDGLPSAIRPANYRAASLRLLR